MPSAGKKLAIGSNVVLSVLLGLALVVIVNVFSSRHYKIWDWTATGEFSLSNKTLNILSNLQSPVQIAAFYLHPGDPLDKQMRSLLRRYEAEGHGRVIVHFAERDKELEDLKMKQFPIPSPKDRELRVAVKCGDRVEKIPDRKLGTRREMTPYGPMGDYKFTGEAAVTYAIRAVSEGDRKNIAFAVGHGEKSPLQLKKVKEALERENLAACEINLQKETPAPESTQVLVIAGPETPWQSEELSKLNAYLQAGGRALILLEPVANDDRKGTRATGLEKALEDWGISVGNEIVLDFAQCLEGQPAVLQFLVGRQQLLGTQIRSMTGVNPGHPVTESLARAALAPLLFPSMRPIELKNKPKEQNPYDAPDEVELMNSSQDSVAFYDFTLKSVEEIQGSPTTRKGPFSLAAAVVRRKTPPSDNPTKDAKDHPAATRLAVYGDADFVSDQIVDRFPLNMDLFLNTVNWLADREESLGIAPKSEAENLQMRLNPEATRWINLTCYLFAPGAVLLIGLGVWFVRRR